MAINSGEHKRQRGGEDVLETKDASSSSSSPSHCKKATTVQGQEVKERENVLLQTPMIPKINSFVVRGYLSIPPVFETIPRTLALFVSVIISLVKRVIEERNSFLAITT